MENANSSSPQPDSSNRNQALQQPHLRHVGNPVSGGAKQILIGLGKGWQVTVLEETQSLERKRGISSIVTRKCPQRLLQRNTSRKYRRDVAIILGFGPVQ